MKRNDIVIRTATSGLSAFMRSVVILCLNKKNHGVPAIIITTQISITIQWFDDSNVFQFVPVYVSPVLIKRTGSPFS